MCLSVVAVRNNDSRLLVVPLLWKDMIVGTNPAQTALMDEVPSFPGTEDVRNFTFTIAIILTFLFVNNVAF